MDWDEYAEMVVAMNGTSRQLWLEYVIRRAKDNAQLSAIIGLQGKVIRRLQAENAALRRQVAARKATGGRPALDPRTAALIERELARGGSLRQVAARLGVSHMTVSRVRDRTSKSLRVGVAPDTATDATGEEG